MIALAASAFPWPGNQNYYRSTSTPCYCAPMICALVPFPTCSHSTPPVIGADGSGNYFTTCIDGRLSFSTVTMVSAIWTVLEMTSVP